MNSRWTSVGCLFAWLAGIWFGFSWAYLLTTPVFKYSQFTWPFGVPLPVQTLQTYNVVRCALFAYWNHTANVLIATNTIKLFLCTVVHFTCFACTWAPYVREQCVCKCLRSFWYFVLRFFSFFAIYFNASWYGHTVNKARTVDFDISFFVRSF